MKNIVFLFFCFMSFLWAEKDYNYSYIDSNSRQISQSKKDTATKNFDILENVEKDINEGKILDAYVKLQELKARVDDDLLRSDIILLESEINLKKQKKADLIEGEKLLEESINKLYINEDSLARAYMLLIEIKLGLEKLDDAKYYIDILLNSFGNEIIEAYGSIYLAKMYMRENDHEKATEALYARLARTKDLQVATIVGQELFDLYLLDNKKDEAVKLIEQIVDANINYYMQEKYETKKLIDKLIANDMANLAIKVINMILEKTENIVQVGEYRYLLAQTYMNTYKKGDDHILAIARELFAETMHGFPKTQMAKDAKVYIDEILLREGKISPEKISDKYLASALMQNKALAQEVVNLLNKEEYQSIISSKTIYDRVPDEIYKRFGYGSFQAIYDDANVLLIKKYLRDGRCEDLSQILNKSKQKALLSMISDRQLQYSYFECLLQDPKEYTYKATKDALLGQKDAQAYLYLEELALNLKKYKEAIEFSQKIEMLGDENFLKKEFLLRFQAVNALDNKTQLKKFFNYARKNPEFISANEENPVIIDFYYQYYYDFLDREKKEEALEILSKLYERQNYFKVYVYSPTVEMELSREAKSNDNFTQAISYFEEALKNTRRPNNDELAEIYYGLSTLYKQENNNKLSEENLEKCKALDAQATSLYKKMCDEL